MNGYYKAIEANGFKIKDFKEFGSYQGTWIAEVETDEGARYIEGSYGSCSGCDSFLSEFNYDSEPSKEDGKFYVEYEEVSENEYNLKLSEYNKKLREFGKGYTDDLQTKEGMISRYEKKVGESYPWDDDKEILEWLKKQN